MVLPDKHTACGNVADTENLNVNIHRTEQNGMQANAVLSQTAVPISKKSSTIHIWHIVPTQSSVILQS